jgi:hypothetical protein
MAAALVNAGTPEKPASGKSLNSVYKWGKNNYTKSGGFVCRNSYKTEE